MLSGVVVIVTDRPGRSMPIVEALQGVSGCNVVGLGIDWSTLPAVAAVVSDLDLSRPAAIHCLLTLKAQPWAASAPLLCVSRSLSAPTLRKAYSLGARACLPVYQEAHHIVTALLNILNPDEGSLNASVQRCADRAGGALSSLFASAQAPGRVKLSAVDGCVDPLLTALAEGGLARWLNTIRAHDDATYKHSLVVAGLAAQFATHLRFPEAQKQRLVRAALVHDVGKARVPRALLVKRGALDPDETTVMRTHAVLGYDILRSGNEADAVTLDAVRHHHEMLDGSGYPDGLSGDAVSDVVRVLSICDIYSALTERRSYREAMAPTGAIGTLYSMGDKLEQRFVQAFDRAVTRTVTT